MTKINLLPRDLVIKEARPEITLLVLSGAACAVLFFIYIYVAKTIEKKNIETEISTVEKELAQLQVVVDKIAKIKADRDALQSRKSTIEGLVNTRLVYPIFMEDMLKVMPQGMWLLSLNTQSMDGTMSVKFNAVAYSNYIISDLLKSLEQSQVFRNPEISGITSSTGDKGRQIKEFSINVDYVNQEWK